MIKKYGEYTPVVHETCFIAPGCVVIGNVIIRKNSSVWYNSILRGDIEFIEIGENTNIQDACVLHCCHNIGVIIGDNVTVGHGAILHSCSIGNDSLIGMGSILLDGVKIGKNCLIAAGSVVTPYTEIPDGSLVMGSPAKIKRQLGEEEMERLKKNAEEYVYFSAKHAENNL